MGRITGVQELQGSVFLIGGEKGCAISDTREVLSRSIAKFQSRFRLVLSVACLLS